jgi:membrane fusion protein, multidrug efflux system
MKRPKCWAFFLCVAATGAGWSQTVNLVPVVSKAVSRTTELPAEILPYLSVPLHARVPGYVEKITVDRGSAVDTGQVLVELSAPELKAQIAVAESKVQEAESERAQAEAQLAAAQSTAERLQKASQTPGAVAENELIQAQKQVEAAQALVRSRGEATRTAQAAVDAQKDMEAYLRITAPFDGVVTERLVHPGALVGTGAGTGADSPLLVIQQVSRLRVVVAIPEEDTASIVNGAKVEFHVPAYPERAYFGTVARIAHALDPKTRTMPVELDVENRDGSLSPGMYPSVKWPIRRSRPVLFVPRTSVVATTERVFVIRDRDGHAEWVDVRKGAAEGDLVEVTGSLQSGDLVVKAATDEIREGTPLAPAKK